MTLDVGLHYWEDLTQSRSGALRRELVSKHPVLVTFLTRVTATSTNICGVIGAILQQAVTVDESVPAGES